jgi:thiol:disulfide interchange protein
MTALYFLGLLVALVGAIWLIVLAFKESILWGLGSLLIPFVSLIFAITHWDRAKTPFLIQVGGVVLLVLSVMMGGLPGHPAAAGV